MSTPAFDASLHPRTGGGRFTDRVMDEAPELVEAPQTHQRSLEHTPRGTRIVSFRTPAGQLTNGPDAEPAMTEVDAAGRRISRTYVDDQGRIHNGPDDEPAQESYRADGTVIERTYAENGLIEDYRDGSPGWASFYANGVLASQGFYRGGALDDPDEDTPAVTTYRSDGSCEGYTRYRGGVMHSEGVAPTQESYHTSGSVSERTYFTDGHLHTRSPGQWGRVLYRPGGTTTRAENWAHGELVAVRHFRG